MMFCRRNPPPLPFPTNNFGKRNMNLLSQSLRKIWLDNWAKFTFTPCPVQRGLAPLLNGSQKGSFSKIQLMMVFFNRRYLLLFYVSEVENAF
jgi:hypothetical protein